MAPDSTDRRDRRAAGDETVGAEADTSTTAEEAGELAHQDDVLHLGELAPDIPEPEEREVVFDVDRLSVLYGGFRAVKDVSLQVNKHEITAFIGPSGCGKTTVLRCFNRMNDLIAGAGSRAGSRYHGIDLYDGEVNPVEVRRRIGMVFQKPNPFPKSIYDNVAYGPRLSGVKNRAELDDIVEEALRQAALWDEVKDRLKKSALGLSGGQQQRLCIARALAVRPRGHPHGRALLGPRPHRHAAASRTSWRRSSPSTRSSS